MSSQSQAAQQEDSAKESDPLQGNDATTEVSKPTANSASLAASEEASEDAENR